MFENKINLINNEKFFDMINQIFFISNGTILLSEQNNKNSINSLDKDKNFE
jgi:hypothetical protein